MAPFDRSYTSCWVCHSKYSSILYIFRDIWSWTILWPWHLGYWAFTLRIYPWSVHRWHPQIRAYFCALDSMGLSSFSSTWKATYRVSLRVITIFWSETSFCLPFYPLQSRLKPTPGVLPCDVLYESWFQGTGIPGLATPHDHYRQACPQGSMLVFRLLSGLTMGFAPA